MTERLFDGQNLHIHYNAFSDRGEISSAEYDSFESPVQTEVVAGTKKCDFITEKETGTVLGVEIPNFRNFILDALGLAVRD